jgi:hypothetical protein
MAIYPTGTVSFTEKVNLVDIVNANDVNVLYREVTAIAADLGVGTGLRYSPSWATSGFATTTTWSGLAARLANIEKGVYTTYSFYTDKRGGSTIQPSAAGTIGLTISGHSSQTADLFKVTNSGGSTFAKINSSGTLTATISGGTP